MVAAAHAADSPRKMTVVAFGLFGDEGVFRREATGAARIVANRFGGDQDGWQRDCRDACNDAASGGKKDEWRERHSVFDSYVARLPRWPCRRGRTTSRNPHAIPSLRDAGPHGGAKQGRDHFSLLFWRLHTSSRRC